MQIVDTHGRTSPHREDPLPYLPVFLQGIHRSPGQLDAPPALRGFHLTVEYSASYPDYSGIEVQVLPFEA